MRSFRIYIILFMLAAMVGCEPETNWTYSLDKNSTEPYGLYLAYHQLSDIFPNAKKETIYDLNDYISENRHSYKSDKKYSLLISVTNGIQLNKKEAEDLYVYVSNGGVALMISNSFSGEIDSIFDIKNKTNSLSYPYKKEDSLSTYDILWDDKWYSYDLDMPFDVDYFDEEVGWGMRKVDDDWKPNIVMREIGDGQIIFSNAPEMFTNYALLKDSNIAYYEKLLSSFGRSTYYIKWFSKKSLHAKRDRSDSSLMLLLKEKSYRYAFFVLLALAVLFLLFETKRRQREVTIVPPVTNDSLSFTETIGKLYYGEKDNRNLAGKMIKYYLEHIRVTHNVPTTSLDKKMADKLARKLSKSTDEVEQFIQFLKNNLGAENLSEDSIKNLYHKLKKYS